MLTLADLFAFSEWGTAATLDAASALPGADWTRDVGGSFPTLQAVFEHTAGGEWVWMRRWAGDAPTTFPEWTGTTTPEGLRDVFEAVWRERRAWLSGTPDLDAPQPYTLFNGTEGAEPLGVQMQHVVNHSTYHRGQAAAMLRRLGATPPSTDLVAWVRTGSPGR